MGGLVQDIPAVWARSIAGKSVPEAAPAAPRNRRRGSMVSST
jgi:hypothetical protein